MRGGKTRLFGEQDVKTLCQCIGLSSLLLVVNYGGLLGGGQDVRMHVPFPLTGVCLAQVADILLVGLALFAVLAPLKRTRFFPWLRLLICAVSPPLIIEVTHSLYAFVVTPGMIAMTGVAWLGVLLLLLLKFPDRYRRLMKIGDAVGIFLAIFAFCSIAQILWLLAWKPGPQQHTAVWATAVQPPREHPLLVWIIFDELSYQQVFERRAHDLALPNFDALREESTVFTDVQPVGIKTVMVLPSLLSGKPVDDFRFGFFNKLKVHDTGQRGFHPLSGSETVFGDAQQNGWRTAAIGWYNPYCTLYASSLDDCYWTNLDRLDGPMAQQHTLWQNTWTPLRQMARTLDDADRAGRDDCTFDVRQRFQTQVDLQKHTLQVLHSDQADFVFLHLPVPHSPNIWSRARGDYLQTCGGSYLDNLALADRVLGEYLAALQSSPRWNQTTLIVEGDHGWRVHLWDWLPVWTSEDDLASRRVFDTRPTVVIHEAGQTRPQTVTEPWSLLNVHGFVEDVLHGRQTTF